MGLEFVGDEISPVLLDLHFVFVSFAVLAAIK